MQFEFSNINTQYTQTNSDVIASITKENANASKSNIDSVYNSSDLNLDAAVVSISSNGSARINAMLSKSIQLRACTVDPNMTTADRQQVSRELQNLRREMEQIRTAEDPARIAGSSMQAIFVPKAGQANENLNALDTISTDEDSMDVSKMMEESMSNILKNASESLQAQGVNRAHALQLLL